jgi:type III restriction enzyme
LRQGIRPPLDEPSDAQKLDGAKAFLRYACKMATGAGKTTVMGMVAAWSILNKVNDRGRSDYSDVVLVVCPNVTIKNRLTELKPELGEASIYRSRDLVPPHLMPSLNQGRVLVTNWHLFEVRGEGTAKVQRTGVEKRQVETIVIGPKTTTAHRYRYMTREALDSLVAAGRVTVLEEMRDAAGNLEKVKIETSRFVESDGAWIKRVLGREVGGKQNILVMNDEAHHAYRIKPDVVDEDDDEEEEAEEFFQEATVWIEGLDRINRQRGINFCLDLSATPYFLGRVGQDTNKPFPWVVSDFGLTDAIESGLVKIPQLALRDPSGKERAEYFNVWKWIMEKLTPAEKGGKKGQPKPEAVLKYADTPISMLAGYWDDLRKDWAQGDDPRPPVYIIVCKNTKLADMVFDWVACGKGPSGIPPLKIEELRNRDGQCNTICVHSKLVYDTDSGAAKSEEDRWMRLTLDTVGKRDWPADSQGRPIYPEDFEALAQKLGRPLHPPGRDVHCIVSVGMLTEGWDCNTVTHIIGLRPFMSQLLCEQVAGRGLRRTHYETETDGKFSEEVAQILGVPFEVVPYKAQGQTTTKPPKKHHVHAVPEKEKYRIEFPRVEGYTQAIRNRVTVDWQSIAPLLLDPMKIPPEVALKASLPNNKGLQSLCGPGREDVVNLDPYRRNRRVQELQFEMAKDLTRDFGEASSCAVPVHVLFPQMLRIVGTYLETKVNVVPPAKLIDVFLPPYYGLVIERLTESIRPDTSAGEAPEVPKYEQHRGPGSTDEVDTWTSKDVRPVSRSHVNFVVADTQKWEQSAAYFIDTHSRVDAFVKNAGLGFAIPYFHNGQPHDYMPDFIIRLKVGESEKPSMLILETKGYDELEQVKREAAERWVNAINADGKFGRWHYAIARKPTETAKIISQIP